MNNWAGDRRRRPRPQHRQMFDAVLQGALREKVRKKRVPLAAVDGTGMESDYDYTSTVHAADLDSLTLPVVNHRHKHAFMVLKVIALEPHLSSDESIVMVVAFHFYGQARNQSGH